MAEVIIICMIIDLQKGIYIIPLF